MIVAPIMNYICFCKRMHKIPNICEALISDACHLRINRFYSNKKCTGSSNKICNYPHYVYVD